ncbi:hypothetical protein CDO52_02750 [Nocardiopsis gilva YIM 90087]|uniref:Major facilitator superfamily (MFS) profile domain-containing protein n=1 Tax=Nocardiopsis gilva YIM 90087 TaxID=1235441 RepID=A0A223S152_9ACTN|nr:hypothetical protein [Nocardiopsis gilva]ASU81848.1 hypothetical protein CDO52_02750 [Nocardiopsis gilva YIM 90087]
MDKSSERLSRCVLVGAGVGAVAGSVAYFVAQGVGWVVGQVAPSPDANIGLGLAMMALTPAIAGLVAWPGLRWQRVPGAGLSSVWAVIFFYVLLLPLRVLMSALDGSVAGGLFDPAPPLGFVVAGAVPMAIATALGVVAGRAIALRKRTASTT